MTSRADSTDAPLVLLAGIAIGAAVALAYGSQRRRRAGVYVDGHFVPYDDEPTTSEDLAAIEAGRAAYQRGEFVDWRELRTARGAGKARGRRESHHAGDRVAAR